MKQQKIVLPVDGMFCPHCETRIHDALSGLSGVLEVQASYARNRVSVRYDPEKVTLAEIRACICNAGYGVRTEAGTVEIVSILVILLSAYVIVSSLGWTRYLNLFPRIETSLGLAALFVTGLLTSVHCVAMCGGINLTQTALAARGETSLLLSNISYHLGRLISYTAVGALAGGLGRVLSVGGKAQGYSRLPCGAFYGNHGSEHAWAVQKPDQIAPAAISLDLQEGSRNGEKPVFFPDRHTEWVHALRTAAVCSALRTFYRKYPFGSGIHVSFLCGDDSSASGLRPVRRKAESEIYKDHANGFCVPDPSDGDANDLQWSDPFRILLSTGFDRACSLRGQEWGCTDSSDRDRLRQLSANQRHKEHPGEVDDYSSGGKTERL